MVFVSFPDLSVILPKVFIPIFRQCLIRAVKSLQLAATAEVGDLPVVKAIFQYIYLLPFDSLDV